MKIKFTILGEPQGKGRPRFANIKGKVITRTPDATVLYENLIATEYRRQVGSAKFPDNEMVDMRIMAYFTIPASASKKKKKQMEDCEIRPTKKPDMDNIIKVVADSLNQIAYRDDAQVVDCQIRKYYSQQPRIEVTLSSVEN
ncbi:MAG: RusA family crossover junction endodeoxyribonuclease [Sedimentibacter sp.]